MLWPLSKLTDVSSNIHHRCLLLHAQTSHGPSVQRLPLPLDKGSTDTNGCDASSSTYALLARVPACFPFATRLLQSIHAALLVESDRARDSWQCWWRWCSCSRSRQSTLSLQYGIRRSKGRESVETLALVEGGSVLPARNVCLRGAP